MKSNKPEIIDKDLSNILAVLRDDLVVCSGLLGALASEYEYEGVLAIGALRYVHKLVDQLAANCEAMIQAMRVDDLPF